MSLEINNGQLEDWRARVAAFGSSVLDSHNLSNLKIFLKNLQQTILNSKAKQENVNFIAVNLKKFPNLGQFLADLCSNNNIIGDGEAYELIIRCVLLWTVENPTNTLEEKSTAWARSQIRKTVSYYSQQDPCSTLAYSVRFNPDQYNYESCSTISKQVSGKLQDLPPYTWEYIAGLMLPCRPVSHDAVNELSLRCMPLLKAPGAHHFIESLLMCQASSSTQEPLHQAFLDALVESQSNAYSEEPCGIELTFQCQTALWIRYLPALESEVMCLLKRLVKGQPWLPRQHAVKLISSRYLPQACLENATIYTAVDNVLQAFLDETQANPDILRVISYFHEALLHYANDHTKPKKSSSVCNLYPLQYRSLINLLLVSPQGLSIQFCSVHLQHIDNLLHEITGQFVQTLPNQRHLHDLWLVLIKWQTWYYKAIELVLISDWNQKIPGIELICWFNYPLQSEKHHKFKKVLTTVSGSLRQLSKQSHHKMKDLKEAMSLANQSAECCQVMNVIQPMSQMFVLYTEDGWKMLHDIVALALQKDKDDINAQHQLVFILDAIDLPHHLNGHSKCLANHQPVLKHIQDLKQRCVDDIQSACGEDRTRIRRETDQVLHACGFAERHDPTLVKS